MRISRLAAQKAKWLRMLTNGSYSGCTAAAEEQPDPRPETVCFRAQTLAIVRHFFELSSQVGRLPSLLGREFFRSRVTHHSVPSFEDQAVFVHDVELCLSQLSSEHQEIMLLAGLYNLSHEEVAEMLHTSKSAIHLWFGEAMDALSEIFLKAGILREQHPDRRQVQVTRARIAKDLAAARSKPGQSWNSGEEDGVGLELDPVLA